MCNCVGPVKRIGVLPVSLMTCCYFTFCMNRLSLWFCGRIFGRLFLAQSLCFQGAWQLLSMLWLLCKPEGEQYDATGGGAEVGQISKPVVGMQAAQYIAKL